MPCPIFKGVQQNPTKFKGDRKSSLYEFDEVERSCGEFDGAERGLRESAGIHQTPSESDLIPMNSMSLHQTRSNSVILLE